MANDLRDTFEKLGFVSNESLDFYLKNKKARDIFLQNLYKQSHQDIDAELKAVADFCLHVYYLCRFIRAHKRRKHEITTMNLIPGLNLSGILSEKSKEVMDFLKSQGLVVSLSRKPVGGLNFKHTWHLVLTIA